MMGEMLCIDCGMAKSKKGSKRCMRCWVANGKVTASRAVKSRSARLSSNIGEPIPIEAVAQAHGLMCHICKTMVEMDAVGRKAPCIDHVVPVCMGGWTDLMNLRVVHKSCNSKKRHSFTGQLMLSPVQYPDKNVQNLDV